MAASEPNADIMLAYDLVEDCYLLDENHEVVSAKSLGLDFVQWATRQYGETDNHVALDEITQPSGSTVRVSTVFLGMNHNHGLTEGPPLVFETMIFGHDTARVMDRYTSYAEAQAGHAKIVKGIQSK